MQFHLGHDDTALENLMRRLRFSRGASAGQEAKGHERDSSSELTLTEEDAEGSTTVFKGLYRSGSEDGGTSRLPDPKSVGGGGGSGTASFSKPALPPRPQRLGKFLRQACVVMETLCEENLLSEGARRGRGGGKPNHPAEDSDDDDDERASLFPTETAGKGWEEVGSCAEKTGNRGASGGKSSSAAAAANGEEGGKSDTGHGSVKPRLGLGSLLDGVDVVGVAFSRVKRSMLVTAHARTARREPRTSSVAGLGGVRGELGSVLEGCGVVCVWNAENVTVRYQRRKVKES